MYDCRMADDVPWITGDLLDITTMEVLPGSFTFIPHDKRYRRRYGRKNDGTVGNATRYSTPYTLFFRPGFELMRHLTGAELHLLFHIATLIEPNVDHVTLDYDTIAADHRIGARTARNYVTRLARLGLIRRAGPNRVAFNPEYIWCGGAGKREALVHARRRETDDQPDRP